MVTCYICGYLGFVHSAEAVRLLGNLIVLMVVVRMDCFTGLRTMCCFLTGTVRLKLVTVLVIFRPRLEHNLRRLNEGNVNGVFDFTKRCRRRAEGAVATAIRTYQDVSGDHVNTLVIFRHASGLHRVVRANVSVGTGMDTRLVVGVFVPGAPLRSKTVVVEGGRVTSTAYFLPLARGRDLDGRLNAQRETNVNVSRRSSTIIIVMSRRAKEVSVTLSNRLRAGLAPSKLRRVLIRLLSTGGRRGPDGVGVFLEERHGG